MSTVLLDRSDLDAEFARIVDELTRRGFLAGGLGSAALAALAACTSESDDHSVSSASAPTIRTITTATGPVTVPTNPRRVVTLDNWSTSGLLDIGFAPIGAVDIDSETLMPEYANAYRSIPRVGSVSEPSLEKIAALTPDLIVGINPAPVPVEALRKIAPTALFAYDQMDDWFRLEQQFADSVNRGSAEQKVQDSYRAAVAALHLQHADALATTKWAIVTGIPGAWFLYLPDSSGGAVLADAGARYIAAAAGKTGSLTRFSLEKLDLLADADAIIVPADQDGQLSDGVRALQAEPGFTRLNAVRAGRVFPMSRIYAVSYGPALTLLDEFGAALKEIEGAS